MSEIMEEDQRAIEKDSEAVIVELEEQIENMRQRVKLSEAEAQAEHEVRMEKFEKNRKQIKELRQEITELQHHLHKVNMGDDKIIRKAFRKHSREIGIMKGRSGRDAVEILDGKTFDLSKKRDALEHEIKMKEKELQDIMEKVDDLTSDAYDREILNARLSRDLENEYQKAKMKINEAEHIGRKYEAIRDLLMDEMITLPKKVEDLEAEYKLQQADIENLIAKEEKAEAMRNKTKSELSSVEAKAIHARQEKDKVVNEFSQVLEQRAALIESEASRKEQEALYPDTRSAAEELKALKDSQEKELAFYSEAFDRIKEATRVTDINEARDRFVAQNMIRENLQELKVRAEKTSAKLKAERRQLESQLEAMRGAELSTPQITLQQQISKYQSSVDKQKERKTATTKEINDNTLLLASIKTGLWHILQLMEQHLMETSDLCATPADIPLIELSNRLEQVVDELLNSFQGQDMLMLRKQMSEDSFLQKLEEEKAAESTLPTPKAKPAAEEESSSADEQNQKRILLKKEAIAFAEVKKKQKGRGKGLKL